MSTPFNMATSVPLIRREPRAAEDHQSSSWGALATMLRLWSNCAGRAKQRDALMDLVENKHLLRDIGLTRDEALDEVNKPFWK
jgi:uncharacterized protein YjiS (DUF1127 family)